MSKTLMMLDIPEEIENLKKMKEFDQLINHPRVYFNPKTDELFYYEEDIEEFDELLFEHLNFENGYDVAWGFCDGGYFYKVKDIMLDGNEMIGAIKEELELKYEQNVKPNLTMESLGLNIMTKYLEKMLLDLKEGKLTIET